MTMTLLFVVAICAATLGDRGIERAEVPITRDNDALREPLQSADSVKRRLRVSELVRSADPHAVVPLIEALHDPNVEVQRIAADYFQHHREPRAVEPLLKVLEASPQSKWWADPYDALRWNAITALGYQRDRRAVPELLKILCDRREDQYCRRCAALSLGMIGDVSVLPTLVSVLESDRFPAQARAGAALALPMLRKDEETSWVLMNVMARPSRPPFETQIAIVEALGECGDVRAVERLIYLIGEHGRNALAFSAAMSAVKITGGAISDVNIVRVIRDHHASMDGVELYVEEKEDALQKIAERGKTVRVRLAARDLDWLLVVVPTGAGIAIAGIAVAWWAAHPNFRRRHRAPEAVDKQTGGAENSAR